MSIVETIKDYKDYRKWNSDKEVRYKFREELLASPLSKEQVSQAQGLQRVVYDAFEKMDDMSQIYEQKIGMNLSLIFTLISVGLGTFFMKKTDQFIRLLGRIQYKDFGKKLLQSLMRDPKKMMTIQGFAAIIPTILQLPVFFYASKEASRLARHKARQEMDYKDFTLYTPQQLENAKAKSGYNALKIVGVDNKEQGYFNGFLNRS